jgi:hypothetical protein
MAADQKVVVERLLPSPSTPAVVALVVPLADIDNSAGGPQFGAGVTLLACHSLTRQVWRIGSGLVQLQKFLQNDHVARFVVI